MHAISYTQFLSDVSARQVKTVTITNSTGQASGTLASGYGYTTVIPTQAGSLLLDRL